MLLAFESTGDPRFKDYVAKRTQFIVEKTPYFRALDEGATREEILEVVLQMSVLGGFPITLSALETLRELTG